MDHTEQQTNNLPPWGTPIGGPVPNSTPHPQSRFFAAPGNWSVAPIGVRRFPSRLDHRCMLRPVLLGVLIAAACVPDRSNSQQWDTGQPSNVGDEGGPCYGNQTCNGSLACASNLCVNLGTNGDAGAGQGGMTIIPGTGGAVTTGADAGADGTPRLGGAGGAGGTSATGGVQGSGGSSASCVPNCSGRACGPDPVCHAPCGFCASGLTCSVGACISPPLKQNGDTCSVGTECASGYCGVDKAGAAHCYGSALANQSCSSTYDCRWGICILKSLPGTAHVCVELNVCEALGISSDCTLAMIEYCQMIQGCGSNVSASVPADARADLNVCIALSCGNIAPSQTDSTCGNFLQALANGTASCP